MACDSLFRTIDGFSGLREDDWTKYDILCRRFCVAWRRCKVCKPTKPYGVCVGLRGGRCNFAPLSHKMVRISGQLHQSYSESVLIASGLFRYNCLTPRVSATTISLAPENPSDTHHLRLPVREQDLVRGAASPCHHNPFLFPH